MGRLIRSGRGSYTSLKCAQYNGSDEVSARTSPSYATDTQGAIFLRVKFSTLLSVNASKAIGGVGSSSTGDFIGLRQLRNAAFGAVNRLQVIKTGTGAANLYGSTNLAAGTWYSVVLQSNGSAYAMYLNGASETLTALSGSNTGAWMGSLAATRQLVFGAQYSSGAITNYNDCLIDEGMYFDRALTGTEITWLHNGGTPRNPLHYDWSGALKSWWQFGGGRDTGSTIYDEVGTNDLTNQNMDAGNYVSP